MLQLKSIMMAVLKTGSLDEFMFALVSTLREYKELTPDKGGPADQEEVAEAVALENAIFKLLPEITIVDNPPSV